MMGRLILIILSVFAGDLHAQTDDLLKQYEQFRSQSKKEYRIFNNDINREYSEFMKLAWERFQVLPAIPRPKDESVRPVEISEKDKDKPLEDNNIQIDEVIKSIQPAPQPNPLFPIQEKEGETGKRIEFSYLNTKCMVRPGAVQDLRINGCSENMLSETWKILSDGRCNNLTRDCLQLRHDMQLCDWAYLCMLEKMAEACYGKSNEAVLLQAFIYCQTGYKMRLATAKGKLYLLFSSENLVFGLPYISIDGNNYYAYNCKEQQLDVCKADYPKARSLSLNIPTLPVISFLATDSRTLQAKRFPDMHVKICVNKNLLEFYDKYPTSQTGDNIMTRWAMYANTPLDSYVGSKLYAQLRPVLSGLQEKDAVERILNFVQTAFVYEYDDKVWGCDRCFFAEETMYYPYCDCEDRAVLFSRLVRDILGLDVILIYYPGHLAAAVHFNTEEKGDYILLEGKRYIVCDPTYIGAAAGQTMPGMNNSKAKVILLSQ